MSPFYCIRYVDGLHTPGMTTDGRDFLPIPKAANAKPRPVIDYCDMRERAVSPLRSGLDDSAEASGVALRSGDVSSPARSGLTSAPPVRRRSARGRAPGPSGPALVGES